MITVEMYNAQAFPEDLLKSSWDNSNIALFDKLVLCIKRGEGGGLTWRLLLFDTEKVEV